MNITSINIDNGIILWIFELLWMNVQFGPHRQHTLLQSERRVDEWCNGKKWLFVVSQYTAIHSLYKARNFYIKPGGTHTTTNLWRFKSEKWISNSNLIVVSGIQYNTIQYNTILTNDCNSFLCNFRHESWQIKKISKNSIMTKKMLQSNAWSRYWTYVCNFS